MISLNTIKIFIHIWGYVIEAHLHSSVLFSSDIFINTKITLALAVHIEKRL